MALILNEELEIVDSDEEYNRQQIKYWKDVVIKESKRLNIEDECVELYLEYIEKGKSPEVASHMVLEEWGLVIC